MRQWLAKLLLGKDHREEMKKYLREDLRDWVSSTVTDMVKACIDEHTLTTEGVTRYVGGWDMARVRKGIQDSIMAHVDDVIMKKIEDRIQRRLMFINSEKILDEIVERLKKKQIR
jgi:hypothetical protein